MIMKKFVLLVLLISSIGLGRSFGQASLLPGQVQLNTGLFLNTYGLPLYLGADFGARKNFTFGGELSFVNFSEYYRRFGVYYRHSAIGVSGNFNYHFNQILHIPSPWDIYAGLSIGQVFYSSPPDYPGTYASGLGIGGQLGARYYFNSRVGINLEFRGGVIPFNVAKFGLTFKL